MRFSSSFCRWASSRIASRLLEVGLVALPNAGKSQLTNALVGQKITAVSSKRNTTRQSTLGAFVQGRTQVILHDLPGVVELKDVRHLGQADRMQSAWNEAETCDAVTLLVDASLMIQADDPNLPELKIASTLDGIASIKDASKRLDRILALNKIDRIPKEQLHRLTFVEDALRQRCDFSRCFYISALRLDGLRELKSYFCEIAREGSWVLPEGSTTDKSVGELAVELVREKLYRRLNQELPYAFDIALARDEVGDRGEHVLHVEVTVPTRNVRKIVIGRRGNVIDDYVTSRARYELEKILGRRVWLNVNVRSKG